MAQYRPGMVGDCGYAAGSSRRSKTTNNPIILPGQWHHIVAVYKGHLEIDVYVDGIKREGSWNSATTGGSLCYSSSHSGAIGDQYNYYWFDGMIDDIRVYDRVLTEEEINSMLLCEDENPWMTMNGKITYSDTSLCAMVLANGQYMFTCGNDLGNYDLDVPIDENCEITLYGFSSGFAPYKAVLKPWEAQNADINMTRASSDSLAMQITLQTEPGTSNPDWVRLSGTVSYEWTPLCAMILANGQHIFTCGNDLGTFDLEVPLDSNGDVTFYGFCSGLSPYKEVFSVN